MKRLAVLALAAVFAFSFSASVAAAPEFSWELSIESKAKLDQTNPDINFSGTTDVTLSVSASEEGLWKLSLDLGSILGGVALGKYSVALTPEGFDLNVWGGEYDLSDVKDAFGWISSGKRASPGPKYRLTTDLAGVGLTVDYDTDAATADHDALYVFADAGMIGAAFADTDFTNKNDGMVVSGDVQVDLGIATVTGGVAYDLQVDPATDGALAFGVKAESEIAAGLTVNAGFTSDGRDKAKPETEISGGATYELDSVTVGADFSLATDSADIKTTTFGGSLAYGEIADLGVEYKTTNVGDDTPTLTFTAGAEYPVIADVFTISADFKMLNDKEAGHSSATAYTWADGSNKFGDKVITVLQVGASADYMLTPAFTVTPGFDYATYTFTGDGKATATILSVDTTYAVSDAAEITFGLSNITTEVVAPATLPDVTGLELTAGVTITF